MLQIRPQPSASRRDFEPHGPEGARATSSSARSVSDYRSFKYVPNEHLWRATHQAVKNSRLKLNRPHFLC